MLEINKILERKIANIFLGQIKKCFMGLKSLGRVGTHIFFNILFSGKKYNCMHFEIA